MMEVLTAPKTRQRGAKARRYSQDTMNNERHQLEGRQHGLQERQFHFQSVLGLVRSVGLGDKFETAYLAAGLGSLFCLAQLQSIGSALNSGSIRRY
jgi:hypothetical protein